MFENTPFAINENSEKRFYHGWINRVVRIYYYLQEGLNQINSGRNIIYTMFFLAGYLGITGGAKELFKLRNLLILGSVALGGLLLATIIGWLWIRRGKMSTDYFVWRDASPLSKWGTQMAERQMTNLDELVKQNNKILEELKKLNSK